MEQIDGSLLAGFDIGGTKIGVVVGRGDGRVLAADRIENDPRRSAEDLLDEALSRLKALASSVGDVSVLGMACPGPLSYAEGKLLSVPNMPRWQNFPILSHVASRFAGRVAMMNDANASVLAEGYWGAARGATSAVFLTMSTGMGAGLLLDSRVYEGPLALAGEIGHLRLTDDGPVGFGKRGSVEGYLSGPGMTQVASAEVRAFLQQGRANRLADTDLSPKSICDLARDGDPAALAVIDRCGHQLGRLCAWLTDLLNPEVIILGTIGTAYLDLFEPRARRVLDEEALSPSARLVRVVGSGLEDRGNQTALAIARRVKVASCER